MAERSLFFVVSRISAFIFHCSSHIALLTIKNEMHPPVVCSANKHCLAFWFMSSMRIMQAQAQANEIEGSVLGSAGPAVVRPRWDSIDLLRGFIIALMALDHTRDFFTNVLAYDPLDLARTSPGLFLTRWITHFCAPVFIFLAGVGASLSRIRGKPIKDLSWFLFSRGIWLAFLEVTWINFGWSFDFDFRLAGVGVLWAIGWSMVILSALVWLPLRMIGIFGIALITLHNAFDWVLPGTLGKLGWLWTILHVPGNLYSAPGWDFGVGYVLIPWAGVMAAGYAFGEVYTWNPGRRRKWILGLGVTSIVAFIIIRGVNNYGNPWQWTPQYTFLYSIFSFVAVHKYPPSLDYVLMTLGPALILLSLLERDTPKCFQPFLVFGRVPLFFYLLHLPLIHAMALVVALIRHGHAEWVLQNPFRNYHPPPEAGFGLAGVYAFWLLILVILQPICRWFADFKSKRRDAWLSYL